MFSQSEFGCCRGEKAMTPGPRGSSSVSNQSLILTYLVNKEQLDVDLFGNYCWCGDDEKDEFASCLKDYFDLSE